MDAIKILGSLLSSQMSSGRGNSDILSSVLGSIVKGAVGGQSNDSGLGGLLGGLASQLGGGQQQQQQSGGGLGGLLGGLVGGGSSNGGNNQLGSILSGLTQGSGGQADLGKLVMGALGGLAGGNAAQGSNAQPDFSSFDASKFDNNQQAQDDATLLIRAMVNSAKSDGQIDDEEQQNIMGQLGEVEQSELDFIQNELQQPLNVEEFIASVPQNIQSQVYAMSLMTIKLDTQDEAGYLHQLAQGFNIAPQEVNQIHENMGAPKLYS